MSQLSDFLVIDQLRVHQIEVKPGQIKADYTVKQAGRPEEHCEHIFSYKKPFFDPRKPEDINLACMALCQVALNYGLFCREIVLDGLFDTADQEFLKAMLENTSREILTNKLLIDNEFIKESHKNLQVKKQQNYTQAKLIFENTAYSEYEIPRVQQQPARDHYAILSSGGKDSLLSYGIARELGTAHPVYINESGRHWFTAVNAYRYFQETEPNTVKPWTNSDRVFNWMLKQFSFIRENYAHIRADIYPIRLWTVAVFLFGVLPVVRKRNIGNVLIGNEYDTTVKGNTAGISHYNGLFDQSKYFDNTLSRYYRKKGWNIYQYSILRSLSELLIMKILISRYPQLQEHQVSCHAAHERDGKMKPCGNCEKCRRIIGMMVALGANPENCGYSQEQIRNGLAQLASKSVKQIGSDAAHLYALLLEKGAIASNPFTKKAARAHPEILKLRFDKERSNLQDLPVHIRKPLLNILEPYAHELVQREGKHWKAVAFTELQLEQTKYKPYEIQS
ncbi:hypothetical protein [Robiginitalea sp. IMCC43444]|uniref:hypothetical protein n=1 Tax=Robiginitalea sp. IMCC43444 TaxID=3459121 RepID=UPI004042E6E3